MRVRHRISGTGGRPRMMVTKSNTRLSVQLIDDSCGRTLTAAVAGAKNIAGAGELGRRVAEQAASLGIKEVVFDRGGYPFHGRIRAIVEGAVAAGLQVGATKLPESGAAEAAPADGAGTEET